MLCVCGYLSSGERCWIVVALYVSLYLLSSDVIIFAMRAYATATKVEYGADLTWETTRKEGITASHPQHLQLSQ